MHLYKSMESNNENPIAPQQEALPPADKVLIEDEALLGMYDEILTDLRKDRKQVSYFAKQFGEMVLNGGDSSTSSKEALVNLLKIKSDTADKMAKIADLMTRLKMKERSTYELWMNKYKTDDDKPTITIDSSRRDLIRSIKAKNKKDDDES